MEKLTEEKLRAVYPLSTAENRAKYLEPLNFAFVRYAIDTPARVRAFLAVIGHETAQLRVVMENLNYSADGLRKVFGKYFPTTEMANRYARKPEKIANRVYAGRMGNGPESSGDGWKYRGRGLIQLTGKDNYTKATNSMYGLPMGVDFVTDPDLLATPEYATQSAAWFWCTVKNPITANEAADALAIAQNEEVEYAAFKKIVRIVNGGTNGLSERWELYKSAKKVI